MYIEKHLHRSKKKKERTFLRAKAGEEKRVTRRIRDDKLWRLIVFEY